MVIKNTIIGTQIIVVHVTDKAVTFFSIPYGTKNMFVLVIGRNVFITITANHADEINPKIKIIPKKTEIIRGVIITVKRKIFLTITDRITPGIIFALLFFLGISLGMNEKVMANISKLGLYALLISVGGITGSICLSIPLYRYLSRPKDKRVL